jgi:excisionase family DNA binding protein
LRNIKLHPIFNVSDDMVLNPEIISEMLGLGAPAVRNWCRSGKLPSYSFGGKYIIVGSDFKEFMKKSKKVK